MCDECDKIDAKIERYRRIVDPVMDPLTRERVNKLIDDLMAEKAGLHPDPDKRET
jgi:hypothetical protein